MRIAWYAPLHPRSAIGRFSRYVVAALREAGHEVTLRPADAVADAPTSPAIDLTEVDIIVYNLGDHHAFHAGALEALRVNPGVVILHDAYVLNLFMAQRQFLADPRGADALMDELHGAGAAAAVRAALTGEDFLAASALFTMTAWLARLADGMVAHASFYEAPLRAACAGPVEVIPLAYDSLGSFVPLDARGPSSTLRILTFGYMNSNRRVDSVLRAIGGSPSLLDETRFRVAGPIHDDERRRLDEVAVAAGVKSFEILGEVSDEALRAELEAADVICGLRRPTLEGASASAIEAMLSGRPLLVSDAGFFHELPDDLVFKIRADYETDDLRRHLERLVGDRAFGAATGRAAAAWAARTFSADAYARKLIPLLERVIQIQPLLRASAQVGENLAEFGLRRGDPATARVAAVMDQLFAGAARSGEGPLNGKDCI